MSSRSIRNMEDFARASGISRPTVSKYFNDPDSVRKSTRERIEKALETYDFRPNIYAMNQNRRLTKNLGIVVPYLADPFFAEIARVLENHVIEAGYRPILLSSHGNRQQEIENLDSLRSIRPAGVLIAPLGRISDRSALEAFCKSTPTVLFDSFLSDMGDAFVGHDNVASSELICEYLSRTGEPPAFFEMRTPTNPNAYRRRNTYLSTMEKLGHTPQLIQVEGEDWEFERIGMEGGLKILSEGKMPSTTILCSNDRLAIGLLAAAYQKGLRVGHSEGCALRIAGHDNHPWSAFTCPPLTTISQDYSQIAERSVTLLLQLLETGERPDEREEIFFEGKLVLRESA